MNTDVCDRCFDAIYKHYMNSIEISDIKTMRGSVRGKMIHLTTNHEVRIRPLDDGSSIPVTHICPIEVLRINQKLTFHEKEQILKKHKIETKRTFGNRIISTLAFCDPMSIPEWCVFDKFHNLSFVELNKKGMSYE